LKLLSTESALEFPNLARFRALDILSTF